MENKTSIKFYLQENNQNIERPKVYMRIIINRKKTELATSFSLPPADWDDLRQRAKYNPQINQELAKLESKVYQIQSMLELEQRPVSARIIKDLLKEKDKVNAYLIEFYEQFLAEKTANPELSPETPALYRQTFNYLKLFTKEEYKSSDILVKQIDFRFVTRLDQFLLCQGLCRNTINKHHSRFRSMIHRAIKEGRLNQNPYEGFKLKKAKTDREALTKAELQQLMDHNLGGNVSLLRVRDIFLFSVYTGLRYHDMQQLEPKHIIKKDNGKLYIFMEQQKTEEDLDIPLLRPTKTIVDRYQEEGKATGKILPRISNQKINAYLKVIADLTDIHKKLTHHVARHTCATTILLSNGVSLKAVSKWLGHTNIKQTEIYAKITEEHLGHVADDLEGKI